LFNHGRPQWHMQANCPFGVLLQTISSNGVVFKVFPAWICFRRKGHACRSKPPVPLASLPCPYWTRQPHWRFRHAWGVASQTGEFQAGGRRLGF